MRFTIPPYSAKWSIACLVMLSLVVGCTRSERKPLSERKDTRPKNADVEMPEGDTSVPAELGGPGFKGEGWETATPGPVGDPRAQKGGVILASIPSWPENLRRFGTGSNTQLNYLIAGLCYESLCGIHPQTMEFIPSLATHWQVSDDKMTMKFRINPKAHWSDGKPIVADDWIATYRLINDDTLIEPMTKETLCTKMEEPKALSKYMLEVKCKEKDWRNFIVFSGLTPLPAHEIAGMSGSDFLKKYNFSYTATSGPYIVYPDDIKENESLTITRRNDYWAEDHESNKGLYNFDKISFVVVRDQRLEFEKVCKGEIDFAVVNTAKWWVEDITPLPAYKQARLIRKEVFTKYPKAFQGEVFNLRREPLSDKRLRLALAHLYDRKTMLAKFAYNQYTPLKSYFPSSDAENPDNKMIEYDPSKADELLNDAGWTERGPDGIRVKDGQRLSVKILYRTQGFEKYLTAYKEAAKNVGVELDLQLITPESHWKNMQEHNFQMAGMGWGATLFPGPKTMWHSSMADKEGSNNIAGFKSKKADELIEKYDTEFDLEKRNALLRELDAEIYSQVPYILEWYNPAERILYWDKFGMPDYVFNRYSEWDSAFATWWYDKDKAAKLKASEKSGEALGPIPPLVLRPWDDTPVEEVSVTEEVKEAAPEVKEPEPTIPLEPAPDEEAPEQEAPEEKAPAAESSEKDAPAAETEPLKEEQAPAENSEEKPEKDAEKPAAPSEAEPSQPENAESPAAESE